MYICLISLEFVDKFELTSISLWEKGVLFIYSSLNQLMSLFPVLLLFVTQRNSKQTKMCCYKPHRTVQSIYWQNVSEQRKEIQAEGAALQTNG